VRRATGDPTSTPKDVPHLPGEKGALLAADADGVRLGGPKGAVTLRWQALPAHTWVALARTATEVDDGIDMSVVLLRIGKESEAHALLAKASKKQPARMARVQEVLADARDLPVDGNSFTLVGERWMSAKEYARVALNENLKKDAETLVKGKPEERRAAFEKLRDLGDDARGTLVRALILRIATCNEELQKDAAWKPLVGLKAARVELDNLRRDAFTLIDDEKEYPYPYKPPEAPPEAYGKYLASQKLIDERVALVKKHWRRRLRPPDSRMEAQGAGPHRSPRFRRRSRGDATVRRRALRHVASRRTVSVTIRTIALSAEDRARLQGSLEAIAWSEANPGRSTKGEQDEFKITNDYRMMMGRHAVRMHDRLTQAARGHCEDMARLGFFAHESPVEGRRTPGQRIRAAGVRPIGASENIAMAGGPAGAHNGWTHSSGHHRNLLGAEWRYLGVGNSETFRAKTSSSRKRRPASRTTADRTLLGATPMGMGARMNGKLVVTEAGREIVHELLDTVTVVGKGPDADLTLRDASASARHFEVRRIDQGWKVVDLESKAGTKVNGKFTNQHLSAHGDVIMVGGAKITFMGATAPAAPAAKKPPKAVITEAPKNVEGEPERFYHEPGPKRVRKKDNFALWAAGIVGGASSSFCSCRARTTKGFSSTRTLVAKSDTYATADMKAALDIIEGISKNSDAYDRAQDLKERIQKDLAARRAADDLAKEEAVFEALTKKFHTLKAKDPTLERECTEFLAKAPTSPHVADVKRYKTAAQLGFDPEKRWADVRVECRRPPRSAPNSAPPSRRSRPSKRPKA
jgi:uncharacterized protein YkwD